MNKFDLSNRNQTAWNSILNDAWIRQYGIPPEVAKKFKANPAHKLRRVIDYLPELQTLKIANPLGSHGRIAAALALLGADVTVFDISESKARCALFILLPTSLSS